MSRAYRLTETARKDLGEILEYVAGQAGVERALLLHGRFAEAFDHLSAMPGSGRKRPDLTGRRVRWWVVHPWIVVYDPEALPLVILRVIHGAREIGGILGGTDPC